MQVNCEHKIGRVALDGSLKGSGCTNSGCMPGELETDCGGHPAGSCCRQQAVQVLPMLLRFIQVADAGEL